MRLSVNIRILDKRGRRVFGAGIAELLNLVEETGSISAASRRMGMAYSKSWRIIRSLERALGQPALKRSKGGDRHGGATLTPVARKLLNDYTGMRDDLNRRAQRSKAKRLLRHFPGRSRP